MEPLQQTEWGPRPVGVISLGIAGILLGIGAVTLVTDAPGRILISVAAVGLFLFATFSWRASPKLAIADGTLVIRGWWSTQNVRRADIALIRITEFRRIGRKVRLLEIDTTDDRLRVFTRWDLGTDPLQVLDALTAAGYAG
jgi:cobalamin biosynthesis protein CbiG